MSASVTADLQTYRRLLVPDIAWVTVPAGEFIYGEGEKQTSLSLDAFEIARYPVTNRQYQCFIDDGGYSDGQWWEGLERPQPEASPWPQGNRPKTNLYWYEATAFCRWLAARLDQPIRLPFEHEWEMAARGPSGLVYPWGEDYRPGCANVDESGLEGGSYLQKTTAVGLFPRDQAPCAARDMAGNVREWCNKYPSDAGDGPTPVLRGGSWLYNPPNARAASRHRSSPGFRFDDVGFRLLRSPPS